MDTLQELETKLQSILPSTISMDAQQLAEIIWKIKNGTLNATEASILISNDPGLAQTFQLLAGEHLISSSTLISFGQNNQYGDVIIGDIAAGNLTKITLHINHISGSPRDIAEKKVDASRAKVQQWGELVTIQNPWPLQAWHYLGHGLQLVHEALEADRCHQRAWTLLADIYHRIGKRDLATASLLKSRNLATPGPNHPGRFYKDVERNLITGYPFDNTGGLLREKMPDWFERKYERYWKLSPGLLSPCQANESVNISNLKINKANEIFKENQTKILVATLAIILLLIVYNSRHALGLCN